ncbi:hypothetical protein KKG22_01000 [Patescibacteria group bacterium]|nr:hypothetical protein [Patescibacteria group bacterium]MBU1722013.1 hypothetical protein [Patescibacteria group bacterium]MBU1901237.1 hypothetical protein [Patescibacteria group bacterium]
MPHSFLPLDSRIPDLDTAKRSQENSTQVEEENKREVLYNESIKNRVEFFNNLEERFEDILNNASAEEQMFVVEKILGYSIYEGIEFFMQTPERQALLKDTLQHHGQRLVALYPDLFEEMMGWGNSAPPGMEMNYNHGGVIAGMLENPFQEVDQSMVSRFHNVSIDFKKYVAFIDEFFQELIRDREKLRPIPKKFELPRGIREYIEKNRETLMEDNFRLTHRFLYEKKRLGDFVFDRHSVEEVIFEPLFKTVKHFYGPNSTFKILFSSTGNGQPLSSENLEKIESFFNKKFVTLEELENVWPTEITEEQILKLKYKRVKGDVVSVIMEKQAREEVLEAIEKKGAYIMFDESTDTWEQVNTSEDDVTGELELLNMIEAPIDTYREYQLYLNRLKKYEQMSKLAEQWYKRNIIRLFDDGQIVLRDLFEAQRALGDYPFEFMTAHTGQEDMSSYAEILKGVLKGDIYETDVVSEILEQAHEANDVDAFAHQDTTSCDGGNPRDDIADEQKGIMHELISSYGEDLPAEQMLVQGVYGVYDSKKKTWGSLNISLESDTAHMAEDLVISGERIKDHIIYIPVFLGTNEEELRAFKDDGRTKEEVVVKKDNKGRFFVDIGEDSIDTVDGRTRSLVDVILREKYSPFPDLESLGTEDYDTWKSSFLAKKEHEEFRALSEDLLTEIAPNWEEFLEEISDLAPHEKLIEIKSFIKYIGYYDFDNGDVSSEKNNTGEPNFRLKFAQDRMKQLQKKNPSIAESKEITGVCADFALITSMLLRKAGFLAGTMEGFSVHGGDSVRKKHGHAISFVLWPNGESYSVVPIDATAGGDQALEGAEAEFLDELVVGEESGGYQVEMIKETTDEDTKKETVVRRINKQKMSPLEKKRRSKEILEQERRVAFASIDKEELERYSAFFESFYTPWIEWEGVFEGDDATLKAVKEFLTHYDYPNKKMSYDEFISIAAGKKKTFEKNLLNFKNHHESEGKDLLVILKEVGFSDDLIEFLGLL